jgi:hypothetical protein
MKILMIDIYNLFLKYNPDFRAKLEIFPTVLKTSLIRKLKNTQSEVDFLSHVSEINFGLLFNKLGFNLNYEKLLLNGKTPDWEISIENAKAICEVYRLGQSIKDLNITSFENKLKRGFEEIPYGYQIKYGYEEDCINADNIEIENIVSELNDWLSCNREIGERVTILEKTWFEIRAINQKKKLTYISSAKSIDYKIHRLVQKEYLIKDNVVSQKLSKYSNEIRQLNIPYFLCIENDFKNGLNFEEYENYFQGSWCICSEDDNFENDIEYTELGCLYNYSTVSGIIIKIGNDYRKILNPLKNQIVYNSSNQLILNRLNLINNACA